MGDDGVRLQPDELEVGVHRGRMDFGIAQRLPEHCLRLIVRPIVVVGFRQFRRLLWGQGVLSHRTFPGSAR